MLQTSVVIFHISVNNFTDLHTLLTLAFFYCGHKPNTENGKPIPLYRSLVEREIIFTCFTNLTMAKHSRKICTSFELWIVFVTCLIGLSFYEENGGKCLCSEVNTR